MGASSRQFIQERMNDYDDMPTYDEVTNSDDVLKTKFKQLDKLESEIEALEKRKAIVLEHTKTLAFSFYNDSGLPIGLINKMVEKRSHPYFYVKSLSPLIFTFSEFYKGDYYDKCKCYINPYSPNQETIKFKVKQWNRDNE